jgi:ATP-dependent Clp protease adaptor protein ClpS
MTGQDKKVLTNENGQVDSLVVEKTQWKFSQGRRYKVIMLNDDYTPMDVVVKILVNYFNLDQATAESIMRMIHTKGSAVCGIFTQEIAQTKVKQIKDFAQLNEYPLACVMQAE